MIYVEVGIYVDAEDFDTAEQAVEHALSRDKRIDVASTDWLTTYGVEPTHVDDLR